MNIKRVIKKAGLKIRKHKTTIMFVGGISCVVVSDVMLNKAARKSVGITDFANEEIDKIKSKSETRIEDNGEIVEIYDKKAVRNVYLKTGFELAKDYAFPVVLKGAAITLFYKSNMEWKNRAIASAAVALSATETLNAFHKRVADKYGEDEADKLKYGITTESVEIESVDENGKAVNVTIESDVFDPSMPSMYARYFDKNNDLWRIDNMDYIINLLDGLESAANDRLIANGYLFLNEVYELLHLPLSKAGQVVGWLYEGDAAKDGQVNFHIKEGLVVDDNGDYEPSILLDFNVDGNIFELM